MIIYPFYFEKPCILIVNYTIIPTHAFTDLVHLYRFLNALQFTKMYSKCYLHNYAVARDIVEYIVIIDLVKAFHYSISSIL